jgi:hypothetical protein
MTKISRVVVTFLLLSGDDFWLEYTRASLPPLNEHVLLAGRRSVAVTILDYLKRGSKAIVDTHNNINASIF